MKSHYILLSFVAALGISASAFAQTVDIVTYDADFWNGTSATGSPGTQAANTSSTDIGGVGVTQLDSIPTESPDFRPWVYDGWDTTLNEGKYIGFTVSPDSNYEITYQSLDNIPANYDLPGVIEKTLWYQMGYRIDEGTGFGAWTLSGTTFQNATRINTWNFDDFTTSGAVEWGLFSYGETAEHLFGPTNDIGGFTEVVLKGEVNLIPEPSSLLLGGLGLLSLLFRRCRAC